MPRRADGPLIDCLEQVVEVLLRCWLMHSQGVRLSVLETVGDSQRWNRLKNFIERYGGDLFTQRFMNLGNLRGILHQGVREYLQAQLEDPDEEHRLWNDLDTAIPLDEAAYWLGITIEAVVENYGQYIDYNSITTQSDRGDMLYTLLAFLRLQANYERLAWNLRPVVLAHEVLVRYGGLAAAETWRAVAERTAPIAEEHLHRFDRLCKKYGMRLPSIAEHLGERFVRPLEVDQLCACCVRQWPRSATAGRRIRSVAWKSISTALPRMRRAPDSNCPVGWKPWNRRWNASNGKPPKRAKTRPIRSSGFRKCGSRGPRSSGSSSKCSATNCCGPSGLNSARLPSCPWCPSWIAILPNPSPATTETRR